MAHKTGSCELWVTCFLYCTSSSPLPWCSCCSPSSLLAPAHKCSIQCCRSGSGIRCLFDPWIRDPVPFWPLDPGSGAFLTPGSGIRCLFDPWIQDPGWVKNQDPHPELTTRSYFRRLRNNFWVKFFDADPGSAMVKIGIWDGTIFYPE